MYQIPQNKAVSDLTYNQQKMLGIVLKLPQKPFRTTDILTYSRSFADNSSSGAIIGSLARIGYIHKLAGGRNKRWCVDQSILQRSAELLSDLNGTTESVEKKETTDELLDRLTRRNSMRILGRAAQKKVAQ